MRALDIAASGMMAQQLNVEVIANNLANSNTTGFKGSRAEFQDLLYQDERRVGESSSDAGTTVPTGVQIGLGVRASAVYRVGGQGTIQSTGNPFDLAINGIGYFTIEMPDGTTSYTRDGSFQVNQSGNIVTADGYKVSPTITVPANAKSVTIDASGNVSVLVSGQATPSQVGQVQLATFINEAGLQALGNNLFAETVASGTPQVGAAASGDRGTLTQGYLEASNVNTVNEITSLITAQRAYEMNSRVIESANQMLGTLTSMR